MQKSRQQQNPRTLPARSAIEVEAFFDHCLAEPCWTAANAHMRFLLEDVGRSFHSLTGLFMPENRTAYAMFLQDATREVIHHLQETNSAHWANLKAITIQGPVAIGTATPFHTYIDHKELPGQTISLFQVIYQWLFTFLGKSSQHSNVRFLDASFTSQLELLFIFSEVGSVEVEEIHELVKKEFITVYNFSPPLAIGVRVLGEIHFQDVLPAFFVFDSGEVAESLKREWSEFVAGECYRIYASVVAKVVRDLVAPQSFSDLAHDLLGISDSVMGGYMKARSADGHLVSLDLLSDQVKQTSEWRANNHRFFQMVQENDFDSLIVEDATRQLGDEKGYEKENRFTLCKVIGLKRADELVRAERVMLKVRGISYYRGALHHVLDAIKEYVSYAYIHNRLTEHSPYLLEVGPLVFTLEKLEVPFGTEETRHWIGFFIEELTSPAQGRLFTSRVVKVTDFWSQEACLRKIFKSAQKRGVQLDRNQLINRLKKLAHWSWSKGMSIDYCDAVMYLDSAGDLSAVKIIDFERLSFGELVNERHIVLDTLVDVKTNLRPEYWDNVLQNVYLSMNATEKPLLLSEVKQNLRKRSAKRAMIIGILHALERSSRRRKKG